MSINKISSFSAGGHFVWRSGNVWEILVKELTRIICVTFRLIWASCSEGNAV